MNHETDNSHIQSLISEASEMSKKQFDPEQLPHFDEIAQACRQQNLISDEIKVLELAVEFYENSDLQYDQRLTELNKYKAILTARQKEAKVLEVLGW
jgi:hypothetical protein